MTEIPLGTYGRGQRRTYRLTARMPDGGPPPSERTGDNLYQGAALSLQYDWTMTADTAPPGSPPVEPAPSPGPVEPAPTPGPVEPAPSEPTPTPTGASEPAKLEVERSRVLRDRGVLDVLARSRGWPRAASR